ncbi:MAG: hypothetical protein BMS9Abin28_0352 [Anaerolineae bacterium]|nr:MAG: hypothetical protein BMS9Abin28_0352 [Anaerolineae bacterium]
MCGKPNPGGAEECVHCGARLKPLEAGGKPKDTEDWLDRMREEAAEPPTDSDSSEAVPSEPEFELDFDRLRAGEEVPGQVEEEVPEWLQRIREKQAEEPTDIPTSGEPAPEEALRAAVTRADEVQIEQTDLAPEGDLRPASEPEPTVESPDWLEGAEDQDAETEEGLPHVPALVGGAEESADAELGDLGLPDWLGEIEPLEDEEAPRDAPDLAPATLPNWLEAMRPVETFRSVVEIESEDDQAVESVGPLAGLSGVLLAEPVVAMPRTSSVGSMQLDVSERQYAQAELLHRLVDEEEREAPAKPKRKTRLAVFRWAIAAIVLVAVSLPIVTGAPSFALPGLEPRELGALFNLVEQLPGEQPVLVVFDYEPGYAGELEAVSGAFLDQIMARGLPLASMSTRPTGSALAMRAMDPYADRHGYENGQGIVHLGYLSGGPTAVQLFAFNPREAVLEGFALPEELKEAGLTAWDTPVLDQVQALSDFGMVAVITADSESARVWAEQARPNMGDTPLVVVLSAGAEPLIRPYFESDDPKVGGILSGLPAAAAYELRNGRSGLAQERWDAFGAAMLAAEFVLLAGISYGLLIWWRNRSLA